MSEKNIYDDSAAGGFTYEEKLALVKKGELDPAEIGMASPNDANLDILDDVSDEEKLKQAKLGTDLIMEIGEVPVNLRAMWAMQDLKIAVPKDDQAEWIESWATEHKDEHLLQARIRCGYVSAVMEYKCSDAVLGIIELMQKGAAAVKEKYEQQLALEKSQANTDSEQQSDSGEAAGENPVST